MAKTRNSLEKKYLYIDGVNSRDLVLAFFSVSGVLRKKTVEQGTRTEKLVGELVNFMGQTEVAGIIVAQGGGSFSQARIVCAVVNALAYTKNIKLMGINSKIDLADIVRKLPTFKWHKMLLPEYYGPAVGSSY